MTKCCAGWGRIFIVLSGARERGTEPDPNPVFRGDLAGNGERETGGAAFFSKKNRTPVRTQERVSTVIVDG